MRDGFGAEAGRRLVVGGDTALTDAGALDDPLVVGLDHALEVGVGQDAFDGRYLPTPTIRAAILAP